MEELKPSHLGIVVRDADKSSQFLTSLLGLGPWKTTDYIAPKESMIVGEPFKLKLMYTKLGTVTLELLQPVAGKSIWADFLETNGEGLHHIAFKVTEWEHTVSKIKAQGGIMLVGAAFQDSRWCYCRVAPSGMIVEFMDNYEI
jgi:methylmalonyl-CoA/ethylmalonyl-CoA epimerase